MTPFEQAVQQVEAKIIKTPDVMYEGKQVNYFKYQLAVHKYYLSLMSKGIGNKQVKLKDLKQYYGLTGRSAADCLPQFINLMEQYLK